MAIVHCKKCGGSLELPKGMTYAECSYCKSALTFPNLSDESKIFLYNRAEHLRRNNDFDNAFQAYAKMLEIDESDPEIYWGLVLCRYGISYEINTSSGEYVPVCHSPQMIPVLQDSDFQETLKYADKYAHVYVTEGLKIAEVMQDTLTESVDKFSTCINRLNDLMENQTALKIMQQEDISAVQDLSGRLLNELNTLMAFLNENETWQTNMQEQYVSQDAPTQLLQLKPSSGQTTISSEELFKALNNSDTDYIQKFLSEGGDINIRNGKGYTMLGTAVLDGLDAVAKYLIEKGADVNLSSGQGKRTPLHLAILRKSGESTETIKLLLEYGANPNIQDPNGNTPLSLAFAANKITISPQALDYLLQSGADPDYTIGPYTPLIEAAQDPSKHELLRILLEGGANKEAVSQTCGGNAMDYARGAENMDYLMQLGCVRRLDFDPIEYDATNKYKRMSF